MSFKLTWKTHVICFVMGVLITLILGSFIDTTLENFITAIYLLYPAKHLMFYSFLSIFLLLAPITAIHEAIHGITYIIFGG